MLKSFLHQFSYHSGPIEAFNRLFYFIVGALASKRRSQLRARGKFNNNGEKANSRLKSFSIGKQEEK